MTDNLLGPETASGAGGAGGDGSSVASVSSGSASAAMVAAATAAEAPSSGADTSTPVPGGPREAASAPIVPKVGTESSAGKPAGGNAPIPFDRHETILKNARTEAAKEAVKEYAWANGLDPNKVTLAMQLLTELQSDTQGFYRDLGARINPARESGKVEEFKLPDPDLISPDGKLKTYSDEKIAQLVDGLRKQILGEVQTRFKPVEDFYQNEQTRTAKQAEFNKRATAVVSALKEARTLPHFTPENEPQIMAKLAEIPAETRRTVGDVGALHMAYNFFLRDVILPGIDASAAERVRKDNEKKAAASGSVHPVDAGGGGGKVTLRDGDVGGLAEHMRRLSEGAAASA